MSGFLGGIDTPATFEGVRLTDVLAKVDLPVGEKFHNTAASYYLVVEAKDGYRATLAWAELNSTFMDRRVYLVTKRDGLSRFAWNCGHDL